MGWDGKIRSYHYSLERRDNSMAALSKSLGKIFPGHFHCVWEGKGYPFQYSGLENSKDYIVHGVAESQTRLSDFHWLTDWLSVCIYSYIYINPSLPILPTTHPPFPHLVFICLKNLNFLSYTKLKNTTNLFSKHYLLAATDYKLMVTMQPVWTSTNPFFLPAPNLILDN